MHRTGLPTRCRWVRILHSADGQNAQQQCGHHQPCQHACLAQQQGLGFPVGAHHQRVMTACGESPPIPAGPSAHRYASLLAPFLPCLLPCRSFPALSALPTSRRLAPTSWTPTSPSCRQEQHSEVAVGQLRGSFGSSISEDAASNGGSERPWQLKPQLLVHARV